MVQLKEIKRLFRIAKRRCDNAEAAVAEYMASRWHNLIDLRALFRAIPASDTKRLIFDRIRFLETELSKNKVKRRVTKDAIS